MNNETAHECIIGILARNYRKTLVTLPELNRYILEDEYVLDQVKLFPEDIRLLDITLPRGYKIRDYCNRQLNTGLKHFEFCPECGAKIDWHLIKRFG